MKKITDKIGKIYLLKLVWAQVNGFGPSKVISSAMVVRQVQTAQPKVL